MYTALIVEDCPLFRRSLNDALRKHFPRLSVEEAEDGAVALEILRARMPDLVFMDINLPRGNGLDLTRVIRSGSPTTIVVILTSHDLPEYRLAAYRSGANYFLPKGASSEAEMLALTESILSGLDGRQEGRPP